VEQEEKLAHVPGPRRDSSCCFFPSSRRAGPRIFPPQAGRSNSVKRIWRISISPVRIWSGLELGSRAMLYFRTRTWIGISGIGIKGREGKTDITFVPKEGA